MALLRLWRPLQSEPSGGDVALWRRALHISISVIVLPLTLLASVWGMNVGVPGEGDLTAFWIILGGMAALLVSMVAYFRSRGWL